MSNLSWREITRQSFTQLGPLLDFLQIPAKDREVFDTDPRFPILLPLRLAKKIKPGDIKDPILLQFVPLKEEKKKKEGYCQDPVQDQFFRQESRLLHKYATRSLLLTTSACAMHCRFCFRKNFPYETSGGFDKEISILENDPSIQEVILSGGDPLSLSNENLRALLLRLNAIPHVKRIRFHTRFPIGIPERIDEEFLTLLASIKKQVLFVIHVNHPLELDQDIFAALKKLSCLGIPVLTHTVLLNDVNDKAETLIELFTLLVDNGIMPYCLNDLDRVEGTQHFEVEREKSLVLMKELQAALSGYAVPHFVKEIPGKPSKTRLA